MNYKQELIQKFFRSTMSYQDIINGIKERLEHDLLSVSNEGQSHCEIHYWVSSTQKKVESTLNYNNYTIQLRIPCINENGNIYTSNQTLVLIDDFFVSQGFDVMNQGMVTRKIKFDAHS